MNTFDVLLKMTNWEQKKRADVFLKKGVRFLSFHLLNIKLGMSKKTDLLTISFFLLKSL